MKLVTIFVIGTISLWSQSRPAVTDDWISLFDGRSLAGWHPEQGAKWHVSAGALTGDAGDDGWLRSDGQFTNFLLKIEYRNSPKGNSGIFLRATKESNLSDPSNPAGGYELQINNEDEKWATGSIENFMQRLMPVNPAPNQWHAYEVELRGDHVTAMLDGAKVLDGHHAKFKVGYIGLQHHKDNKIEFRNINLKRLPD
jgi:hypothetical protein